MNKIIYGLAATTLALLATAAGAKDIAFHHEEGVDHFGYYFLPEDAPMVGDWAVNHFHIGFEFDEWETGERTETYAPVMVEFDDTSSEQLTNELGGTYYENSVRVLPTSYDVSADSVSFTGEDPEIGKVSIEGKFLPGDEVRLVGTISYGDVTIEDVEFGYSAGD